MRAASTQLKAAIATESTTLARLWRVTRSDGTVLRFTDSVRPITIEVSPDVAPQVYRSDISFTASAIFTSKTFANAQSVTVSFIMTDDGFAEKDIRSRLFDSALGEVMVVDYEHPEYGVVNMYQGTFGTITLSDQKTAQVEIIPSDSFINGVSIGNEKYSQTCRANLGDSRCTIDIQALKVSFVVTSASGGSLVADELDQDNAHWALGFVKWTTGQNVGKTTLVTSSDKASKSLFLASPPFFAIQVGDEGDVFPGCDKLRKTCKEKFDNVLNLRAEPDVPDGAGVPGSNYGFNTTSHQVVS